MRQLCVVALKSHDKLFAPRLCIHDDSLRMLFDKITHEDDGFFAITVPVEVSSDSQFLSWIALRIVVCLRVRLQFGNTLGMKGSSLLQSVEETHPAASIPTELTGSCEDMRSL